MSECTDTRSAQSETEPPTTGDSRQSEAPLDEEEQSESEFEDDWNQVKSPKCSGEVSLNGLVTVKDLIPGLPTMNLRHSATSLTNGLRSTYRTGRNQYTNGRDLWEKTRKTPRCTMQVARSSYGVSDEDKTKMSKDEPEYEFPHVPPPRLGEKERPLPCDQPACGWHSETCENNPSCEFSLCETHACMSCKAYGKPVDYSFETETTT
ncbi:hypothetical protein I302_109130 [Kwoniella bestiolae CBS 10118]|uniref:Uncharacterized protein n=1 Tax=Kwoniella bestiolae CBS 10118 TaxID=1296100 RepID=A0A1B9FV36_9TREE|nr:hypothetical protein I302_08276 [Kwoniella bestiolae CBS 10118]OCF22625.1 hypothetical protein I302_08276 [Kwoniella bestiolae CBS 10118]